MKVDVTSKFFTQVGAAQFHGLDTLDSFVEESRAPDRVNNRKHIDYYKSTEKIADGVKLEIVQKSEWENEDCLFASATLIYDGRKMSEQEALKKLDEVIE